MSEPAALTATLNRARRFAHIDALRAFAVMIVVISHSGYPIIPGDSGVTVFFAISGFIITYLLLRERDRTDRFDARGFYRRRLFKLAPPFIVAIIVPTLVYAATHTVNWFAFASQILFSYNWFRIGYPSEGEQVLPGTDVVWSLAVEEQFYIGFAIIWLFLVRATWWRAGVTWLAVVAIVGSTGARIVLALQGDDLHVHVLRGTDTRLDGIAWGVLAAVAFHAWSTGHLPCFRIFSHPFTLVAAAGLYLGAFAFRDGWDEFALRPTFHAVASVLVIVFGLTAGKSAINRGMQRLSRNRLVETIGLASYSIYLVHHPLVFLMHPLLEQLPQPAETAVDVVVGVLAGILIWRFIEKPVDAFRHRIEARSPQRHPDAGALPGTTKDPLSERV